MMSFTTGNTISIERSGQKVPATYYSHVLGRENIVQEMADQFAQDGADDGREVENGDIIGSKIIAELRILDEHDRGDVYATVCKA